MHYASDRTLMQIFDLGVQACIKCSVEKEI